MPRRNKKAIRIESCIRHFLNEYRRNSHLDEKYGGAYFWNERDIQWALVSHLRERSKSRSIGSKWCIHAEGSIDRPRYVRTERWPTTRRADIVIINHNGFKRAIRDQTDFPPYEAMIEIKLIWPGVGRSNSEWGIKEDINKLEACLAGGLTKNAFFILLDSIGSQGERYDIPYYQEEDFNRMKTNSRLVIYHWPDYKKPIESIKEAKFKRY